MNTAIAIFEVKKYMEIETLDKANRIKRRIDKLEKLESILSGREEITVSNVRHVANFPGIYGNDYGDYEALREAIEHFIYLETIKARKELDAL